jgi:hypothetical protein
MNSGSNLQYANELSCDLIVCINYHGGLNGIAYESLYSMSIIGLYIINNLEL